MSSAMSEKRQQKINTLILTDLARQSIIDLLKSAYTYGWIDSYDHFRVAQLEADKARLERALEDYGGHKLGCLAIFWIEQSGRVDPSHCNCGFEDARAALRDEPQAGSECALFILVDGNGSALVEWRDEGDGWVFPGGKIEPGELPEHAAQRECMEEVGVFLSSQTRLKLDPPVYGFAGHLIHAYLSREWSGSVEARIGQRLAWRPLAQLALDTHPFVVQIARAALRGEESADG